jgi:two-component system, NtrC family, nitrogen regulation sensor histidine kinase NtrY
MTSVAPAPRSDALSPSPWLPALAAAAGAGVAAFLGLGAPGTVAVVALAALAPSLLGIGRVKPSTAKEPGSSAWPAAVKQSGSELVHLVADHVPDAVLFFSDAGVIRYANPVARNLFFDGKPPEGQNFIRLVADAPVPLREALLGESDHLFSMDLDGRRETYHVSRRSFTLDDELHTLLTVKYMTREISRREVDVLKRVVRVISHEVNNSLAPVTSLVHSARLIAKNPEHTAKLDRVFSTIEERTNHLRTFLDGYVVLARLPQPRAKPVDWPSFLRLLSALYPDVKWPPQPPEHDGWFDVVQIEQVFINLIKNACEAGSAIGDVEIGIKTQPDGSSEIDVLDRGRGFSSEGLKNALLPLYSTKESGGGMGLSLSQEIVEAHGGSIAISNRADGGAAMRVILPGRGSSANADLTRSRLTLTRG